MSANDPKADMGDWGILQREIDLFAPFRRLQIPDVISQYQRAPEP
jgi:hypothetical protein